MIVKIVSKKQREHKEIEPTVIRLPANQYEIDDAFLRAKIKKGDSYTLHRFDNCPSFLKFALISCGQKTLEEVNFLTYKIKGMNKEQRKIYEGIVERRRHSLQEGPMTIRELINATFNLECFAFLRNITNDKKLGKICREEELSDEIEGQYDVEKLGAEMRRRKQGYFVAGGFVYRVSADEKDVYDGIVLPEYMKKHSGLIALKLKSRQRSDRFTWLELPAKEQVVLEVIKKIGEVSLDECNISGCRSVLPFMDEKFSSYEDIDKINLLAKCLAAFSEQELTKYKAVLCFEKYTELDDILDLTQNLDCYDYDPEVANPADYTERFLRKAGINIDDPAFTSFDYNGFGSRLLEKQGIISTPYGMVKRNENSLKHEFASSYPQMTLM